MDDNQMRSFLTGVAPVPMKMVQIGRDVSNVGRGWRTGFLVDTVRWTTTKARTAVEGYRGLGPVAVVEIVHRHARDFVVVNVPRLRRMLALTAEGLARERVVLRLHRSGVIDIAEPKQVHEMLHRCMDVHTAEVGGVGTVQVPDDSNWFTPCLFGLLLDYPVVYLPSDDFDDEGGGGNASLSHQPLAVHTVYADGEVLMRFTVPDALMSNESIRSVLSAFEQGLKERIQLAPRVSIEKEVVVATVSL